jgi:hypothetical protein
MLVVIVTGWRHVDVEGVFLDVGYVTPAGFDELLSRGDRPLRRMRGFEELELFAASGISLP